MRAFIAEDGSRPVPMKIRNAPTKLMKDIGMGKDYPLCPRRVGGYAVKRTYLPDGMARRVVPAHGSGLEAKIAEKLAHLRSLDGKSNHEGHENSLAHLRCLPLPPRVPVRDSALYIPFVCHSEGLPRGISSVAVSRRDPSRDALRTTANHVQYASSKESSCSTSNNSAKT